MILWLTLEQADLMVSHALDEPSREVCGLIGGKERNGVLHAVEVARVTNAAVDPAHHFYMDERELVQTMTRFSEHGLSLVGIYHSHPQGDPIPSVEDVRDARYPGVAYVIVGLKRAANTSRLQAWELGRGNADLVELHISADPPAPPDRLSTAGKTAIILTTIMAVAFMILLSLSLLPPAPEIVR